MKHQLCGVDAGFRISYTASHPAHNTPHRTTLSTVPSLLEHLRTRSQVDCDTLDASVAAELGPFVNCTSNQAIAYLELCHTRHADLIQKAKQVAKYMRNVYKNVTRHEVAVEAATILLALQILPNITGFMHFQVNPKHSYSTIAIIENAHRIWDLFRHIAVDLRAPFSPNYRVCIKIPATWEGLQACRQLERKGIRILATTVFTHEQATLASLYDCTYVAPYVNELKVHFEPGYIDPSPKFHVVTRAQRKYDESHFLTKTLPASLTSIDECMRLAGAKHITIAPALLGELANTEWVEGDPRWACDFDREEEKGEDWYSPTGSDIYEEAFFRMAQTRRDGGKQEAKLVSAINIFCDFQEKLEAMMKE